MTKPDAILVMPWV